MIDIHAAERLVRARKLAGYKRAVSAAEALGIPVPTYINYENGTRGFSKHAGRFAQFFRVNLDWLLDGKGEPRGKGTNFRSVTVRGSVKAGHWSENAEWDPDKWITLPIPDDEEISRYTVNATMVDGDSMNRRYPDGTILLWIPIFETGESLQEDKPYIVQRKRVTGEYETTCKIARKVGDHWFLLPDSTNETYAPFPVATTETEEVCVLGRVWGSFRKES